MSFYDSLSNNRPTLQSLKENPVMTLKQAGFNVPNGMSNPTQIINHLLQSGQINNPRLQMAQQIMSRMGRR